MAGVGLAGILFLAAPARCAASILWDEPWNVQSNGQRLSLETFSSRLPPDAVVRELARLNGAYQRYLVGDGRILLSGIKPGEHWLAEIQGRGNGSQGYVSALYFDAARANALSVAVSGGATGHRGGAQRLSEAGIGAPLRVFEFDSSVLVGLVALPAGSAVMPGAAIVDPMHPEGRSTQRSADSVLSSAFHLVSAEAQAGMALAVSMPER